jgi:ABC-type antimicrobial peptide transport system ATPase subunit
MSAIKEDATNPVQIVDYIPLFHKVMDSADVSLKLSEALEVAFIQGNKISKSALGKMLVGLLDLDGDGFWATKTRLLLIAKHLQEVKNYDKTVWKKLRRKFFNDVDLRTC